MQRALRRSAASRLLLVLALLLHFHRSEAGEYDQPVSSELPLDAASWTNMGIHDAVPNDESTRAVKAAFDQITYAADAGALFTATNVTWDIWLNVGRTCAQLFATEPAQSPAEEWFVVARDVAKHLRSCDDLLCQYAGLDVDLAIINSIRERPQSLDFAEVGQWLQQTTATALAQVAALSIEKKVTGLAAAGQARGTDWRTRMRLNRLARLLGRAVGLFRSQDADAALSKIRESLQTDGHQLPQAVSGAKWIELYEKTRSLDGDKKGLRGY